MANKDRVTFGSKIGVILATVGCAVGLGSIWRFPYMVGSNGGGAFLLVFMICTVLPAATHAEMLPELLRS